MERVCKDCRISLPVTDFYKEKHYYKKAVYVVYKSSCIPCYTKRNRMKYRERVLNLPATKAGNH